MKFLIVGAGSIGMRHLKNLSDLKQTLFAVDVDKNKLAVAAPFAKKVFLSLEDALRIQYDAAVICTLNQDHVPMALQCAKAGCHLFIEKPLSLTLARIPELVRIIKTKGLISMVGCNMRFHPAIAYMKNLLSSHPAFRKKLLGLLEFGYYLPFAKSRYETCYQANKRMGGNLIFDGIHELDYAVWFFGRPKKVFCSKGLVSNLKMDTEDHIEMIIKFETGVSCSVHMDYLQHGYCRRCKVVCEDGTALWDFTNGTVGVSTREQRSLKSVPMRAELSYNKMYLDEMKYFIDSVRRRKQTFNSIESSIPVLKLAIAAHRSTVSRRWELIKGAKNSWQK